MEIELHLQICDLSSRYVLAYTQSQVDVDNCYADDETLFLHYTYIESFKIIYLAERRLSSDIEFTVAYEYPTGSSPNSDASDTGSFNCSLACFLKTISGRSNTTGLLNDSDMCPYKYGMQVQGKML